MPADQLEKINILLEKRETAYPVRNETFFELKREIDNYTDHLTKTIDLENWKPDKSILEKIGRFVENPIFICGPMKSGTSLVVNLLDGNRNIVALPGDSHYFRKFRTSGKYFYALAGYWITRMINPTGQSPFWFLGRDEENYKKFLLYLHYFTAVEKKSPFVSIASSVFAANPNRPEDPLYFLEKTPDNENSVRSLLTDFPKAKFVHITRDPLSNIASLKKLFKFRGWRFSAFLLAMYAKNSWKAARANQKVAGKDAYILIKYEDLLKSCREEMEKICRFLNIQYDENLCVPTINRQPAKANSMYKDERASGEIVKNKGNKWEAELTDTEKSVAVSALFSDAVSAGYAWNEERIKKFFKPHYAFLFKFLFHFYRFYIRLKNI